MNGECTVGEWEMERVVEGGWETLYSRMKVAESWEEEWGGGMKIARHSTEWESGEGVWEGGDGGGGYTECM